MEVLARGTIYFPDSGSNGTKREDSEWDGMRRACDNAELAATHMGRYQARGQSPGATCLEDLCQMVDGKLLEIGKDPMDVQVVQQDAETETEKFPNGGA